MTTSLDSEVASLARHLQQTLLGSSVGGSCDQLVGDLEALTEVIGHILVIVKEQGTRATYHGWAVWRGHEGQ